MWGLPPVSPPAQSPFYLAATSQQQIGFFNLLLGCLSPQWVALQHQFWISHGSTCSSQHWTHHFCLQILHVTHTLWIFRNQQLQYLPCQVQLQSLQEAITSEFGQGTLHLLPHDHFFVFQTSLSEGFSLEQVLLLPLTDQQLWLHAVQTSSITALLQQNSTRCKLTSIIGSNFPPQHLPNLLPSTCALLCSFLLRQVFVFLLAYLQHDSILSGPLLKFVTKHSLVKL